MSKYTIEGKAETCLAEMFLFDGQIYSGQSNKRYAFHDAGDAKLRHLAVPNCGWG